MPPLGSQAPASARAARTPELALLAYLSGVPALVYQVVWTREVGLLAGSQVEAISVVLVAFFGGLALGAAVLGRAADRVASPLRLYGILEIAAGLSASAVPWALRAVGGGLLLESTALLAACGGLLLPVTFLLGGTLPALLRAAGGAPAAAATHAGGIVGANTAGAVTGVAVAIASIPSLGLRATALLAGAGAVAVGLGALALAGRERPAAAPPASDRSPLRAGPLVAATLVGIATLGYEVLATRLAALRLGSSLYAWGFVLGLFLAGLAAGNLALARRARRSPQPALDLGWIEVAAACGIALGTAALRPDVARPATGLTWLSLSAVAAGVLPAAFAMGGAFPLLVRLSVRGPDLGAAFGRVSALNTAGGIAGALLAPFVLLPWLGSAGGALACAALNAAVALAFLAVGAPARGPARLVRAALCLGAASAPLLLPRPAPATPWVLFVSEGRQATAVVASQGGDRNLIVDGDAEASTAGTARRTEELLGVLPLLLHPGPRSFLEVGLGSGITLGTARRFPLARVECVEIADSVIRAAPYFAPDNRGVLEDPDVTLVHADARVHLARHAAAFDVVAANTLHPWSVGAGGLYSREYFARLAGALAPGGLAVQWLPVEQIGRDSFALILRTFFDVFPHGALWWGADNVIAVGAAEPLAPLESRPATRRLAGAGLRWEDLGAGDFREFAARRIASAASVRSVLGAGEILADDRPVLEVRAARRRSSQRRADLLASLVAIAREGAREPGQSGAALLWLESRAARAAGDDAKADGLERLAVEAGFGDARRARADRLAAAAREEAEAARLVSAEEGYRAALRVDPANRRAHFGLATLAFRRGALDTAAAHYEALLLRRPDDPLALNELSGVRFQAGDRVGALRASERALAVNPYYLDALANSGLMAVAAGDTATGRSMLARIRAVSPLGTSREERALAAALAENGRP